MRRLRYEQLEARNLMAVCDDFAEGAAEVVDGIAYVIGTAGNDVLQIAPSNHPTKLIVKQNGVTTLLTDLNPNGLVVICGLDGNDQISSTIASNPTHQYGGEGDDSLKGYVAADLLVGGPGNDNLTGHSGSDVLVGGDGADRLSGNAGNDVAFHNRLATINGDEDSFEAMEEVRSLWATDPAAVLAILDYDALDEDDDDRDRVFGSGIETIFSGTGDY